MAPLNPSPVTALPSSAAAAFGSGVASVAHPCRRSGRWRTASASLSLQTACNATASARSKFCSPGVVIDTTATSRPVSSSDALGVDFQESGGELIVRRMDERNVLPLRLQCVPRVDQLGCREVFFQTND